MLARKNKFRFYVNMACLTKKLGISPPVSVKDTAVYLLIEDSNGVSICFVCMNEYMDKRAKYIADLINNDIGQAQEK